MRKYIARVLLSFNPSSRLDWVLLWLMVYLILVTIARSMTE